MITLASRSHLALISLSLKCGGGRSVTRPLLVRYTSITRQVVDRVLEHHAEHAAHFEAAAQAAGQSRAAGTTGKGGKGGKGGRVGKGAGGGGGRGDSRRFNPEKATLSWQV